MLISYKKHRLPIKSIDFLSKALISYQNPIQKLFLFGPGKGGVLWKMPDLDISEMSKLSEKH